MASEAGRRSPWTWVPSLYFAQGIPYVLVTNLSVIMYKRMGLSNTQIALYTSLLGLPWVIKPLWSPLVDMFGTKRRWVLTFQFIMTATMGAIVLSIPLPGFLQYTLLAFLIMGFSSATHDIAADGFYMLALPQHQQAAYAGVRNTFWRAAFMTSMGPMVMVAGLIEGHSGLPPVDLKVAAVPADQVATAPAAQLADLAADGELRVIADPPTLNIGLSTLSKAEATALAESARAHNQQNGFVPVDVKPEPSWWQRNVSDRWSARVGQPVSGWIQERFGEARKTVSIAGNCGVATLRLSARPEPGREVVVTLAHYAGNDNIKLVEGARLAFNESNWDSPGKVVFQLDPNLVAQAGATTIEPARLAVVYRAASGRIPLAWSITFVAFAVAFGLLALYHNFILPRPDVDGPSGAASSVGEAASNFVMTFVEFFRKPGIITVMFFLLFYRFGEAQLVKLVQPFLLDPRDAGGLGLTTSQVGWAYGTFGVASLLCGGLLGGYVVSTRGLKFWLWPMFIILSMGGFVYLSLAWFQPDSLALVCAAVSVEQFGYGFSFTAYILFMISVCEGKYKTAHYAICTGFMALSMMIPGMFSGWLQEILGYRHFFIWVLLSTIPAFIIVALIKVDPEFGRKRKEPPKEEPKLAAVTTGEDNK